tara:strand:- start:407 stop:607 length:201 start_codon:yes stop_codon:yes gene_type:complete
MSTQPLEELEGFRDAAFVYGKITWDHMTERSNLVTLQDSFLAGFLLGASYVIQKETPTNAPDISGL